MAEEETVDMADLKIQALTERFGELRDEFDDLKNKVEIDAPMAVQDTVDDAADELRRELSEPIVFNNNSDVNIIPTGGGEYDVYRDDQAGFKASSYYDSGYKMKVRMGYWVHNTTVFAGSFVGSGDPDGIWPLESTLYAAPQKAPDGGNTVFYVGTLDELASQPIIHPGYRIKLLAGSLTDSDKPKIIQYRNEIATTSAYPDANTQFSSVHPTAKTIEWKPNSPADDAHNGEIQLYGTDDQADAYAADGEYAIPYLQRLNASKDVELFWAPPDADEGGPQSGTAKSIELVGGVFQINQWALASTETPATGDLIVMKDVDGGDVLYCNVDSFLITNAEVIWESIVTQINAGNEWTKLQHEKLEFSPGNAGVGGQNYDHAEAHPVIGDNYSGDGPGVGGVWFSSIGRGSSLGSGAADELAIHLDNMKLHEVTAYWTLDWSAGQLADPIGGASQGKVVLDWNLQRLYDANNSMTADWNARQLDGADWTAVAGTIFKSADITDVSIGSIGSASIQTLGGLDVTKSVQADKFLLHDSTGNAWTDGGFDVDVTGPIELGGTSTLNLNPTGNIQINGVNTVETDVVQVMKNGVTVDMTIAKGSIISVS